MADRMCCFGSCEKETVAVRVTVKGNPDERLVFCSLAHAAFKLAAMEERKRALAQSPQETK